MAISLSVFSADPLKLTFGGDSWCVWTFESHLVHNKKGMFRIRQDSNLRGETPKDF